MMATRIIGQAGRRRDSRLRTQMPATLLTLGGQCPVSLCDLSQSGARFRIEDQPAVGDRALLSWLEFEAFGEVVWARAGYAGVHFAELIAPAALLRTRDAVDYGLLPDPRQIACEEARKWCEGYR